VQTHLKSGRTRQAAEVLQQIARAYPREPRSHLMLGVLAQQAGQIPDALEWLNKTLAIDPSITEAYFIRGVIHQQMQKLMEAVVDYRAFLTRKPNDGKGLNNLGRAMLDLGNVSEAMRILRQAVAANPKNAGAWNNLGEAMRTDGDLDGAIDQYKKGLEVDPNSPEIHANLGAALAQRGDRAAGIASMGRALALKPQLFNAHVNLTRIFLSGGPLDEALKHCQRALELRPFAANAHDLMGNVMGLSGKLSECLAARHRAIELNPTDSAIHSNLLMTLHYLDDQSPKEIFAPHQQWAKKHAEPLTADSTPSQVKIVGDRPLRIGYVSPNFSQHSVAYFFEPVLNAHDRSAVQIYCYSNVRLNDATTKRISAAVGDGWREITGKTDAQVVEMIERDQIDVLVDLAGHTADNRLMIFARKPAPVQMTWLGYPGSTGMSAMDYRLTDAIADPPGESESLHTETLLRIQGGCWVFQTAETHSGRSTTCRK
jgi:predicted O-linked N-acetylglucosamine transferase (SPINDLY family)